ncbi:MAG: 16S rRNA (guanine(966)-N(2))-methyltransferase RsmD [Rhodospirillaceae bacterium]|nr:MAG: 16S rRNA (guanine(966)-N(2))-methyltransferase RsmD [Rhodospirillaceae bacterium]
MRIDSGAHKGKKLVVPEGRDVRPTGDRARQAIFNMLVHGVDAVRDATVLDAFAGSAALGLEALSRGAASLVAFDTDPQALAAIRANVAGCREESRTTIRQADALRPPPATGFGAAAPATLVFLDPPYGKEMVPAALTALDKARWIASGAVVVVELDRRDSFDLPAGYDLETDRSYGKARILMLRKN